MANTEISKAKAREIERVKANELPFVPTANLGQIKRARKDLQLAALEAQALIAGPQADLNLLVAKALASADASPETHVMCLDCGGVIPKPEKGKPRVACACSPRSV